MFIYNKKCFENKKRNTPIITKIQIKHIFLKAMKIYLKKNQ